VVPEPPGMLAGSSVQARPVGDIIVLRVMVSVNPLTGVIVRVEVPVWPATTVMLVGLAAIR
jgi:hypothetical protein